MVGTYEFLDTDDYANMQFIPASEFTNHPQYTTAESGKYVVNEGKPRTQSKNLYISINIQRISIVLIITLI